MVIPVARECSVARNNSSRASWNCSTTGTTSSSTRGQFRVRGDTVELRSPPGAKTGCAWNFRRGNRAPHPLRATDRKQKLIARTPSPFSGQTNSSHRRQMKRAILAIREELGDRIACSRNTASCSKPSDQAADGI